MLGQDNGNVARSKILSHVFAVPVKNAKAGFCCHNHIYNWFKVLSFSAIETDDGIPPKNVFTLFNFL